VGGEGVGVWEEEGDVGGEVVKSKIGEGGGGERGGKGIARA